MWFRSHAAHTFSKLLRRSLSDFLGKKFKDAFSFQISWRATRCQQAAGWAGLVHRAVLELCTPLPPFKIQDLCCWSTLTYIPFCLVQLLLSPTTTRLLLVPVRPVVQIAGYERRSPLKKAAWTWSYNYTYKVKVKFSLKQATKTQRGSRGIALLSLTSALYGVGGQRHAPAALPPGKRPVTYCIGAWVGHRAGLDGCGKSRPPPGFGPRTVQSVASRYTDNCIPYHIAIVIRDGKYQ